VFWVKKAWLNGGDEIYKTNVSVTINTRNIFVIEISNPAKTLFVFCSSCPIFFRIAYNPFYTIFVTTKLLSKYNWKNI